MKNHRQRGIALVTTMLILILLSTMVVGVSWLVMGDQKLGGNNSDRQLAFYGAEAGMESMTASLENLFDVNYAPNGTAINNLMTSPGPPSNIPNIQYLAPGSSTAGSGYQIAYTPTAGNANLPETEWGTIPTGTYAGLVGLMTPYTLTVTARTISGSEARLQRQVQTVAIPVFQFGYFSQMDLSFFAGPNFNFGGRVHTNGNLWLAEGDGDTLTLSQKTTAAGEIITNNLENGWVTTTNYTGAVNITNGSGVSDLKAQTPDQSVTGSTNYYGNIGAYTTTFKPMANTVYNNNIAVEQTGVQPLNLSIATPAIGGQPIDLIRRPQPNEQNTNLGKLQQRYYSEVSLQILLSDYGSDGTCATSDISSTSTTAIPFLATNGTGTTPTPVDLATLAWDTTATGGTTTVPYSQPPTGLSGVGTTTFPLPASDAQGGTTYKNTDGYWVAKHYPIITGCLKIQMQNNTSTLTTPVFTDVTWEILNLGYTGRNINPQTKATMNVAANQVPNMVALPTSQVNGQGPTAHSGVTTVGCTDPSPNAVIRLARLRDNPSSANGQTTAAGLCGTGTTSAFDYWPNVLFDTREAILQDASPTGGNPTAAGAMTYVELDVKNLDKWFTGTLGTSGTHVLATNGFSVYFSDRRGEQRDPNPPSSVVSSGTALTGGYGYEDLVNNYGCPNGTLDQGEDVESDYVSGVSQQPTQLRTYGNVLANLTSSGTSNPSLLWTIYNTSMSPAQITGTELGGIVATPTNQVYTLINSVLNKNICSSNTWPGAEVINARDLRENPPIFFRRALKVVDGDTISLGTCNSVSCGLTIVAENPVYVQACYNNPGQCGMSSVNWSSTSVGASIVGDAVTLLSDNWNDVNGFWSPYTPGNRTGGTTTYRMAVAAGKGIPFKQPSSGSPPQDYGTDGGAHNFLRYLESWSGTLYYEGSIVSMYYNHQAEGIYKCCTTVYSPPTRGYQFDQNYLTPSLLPPLTPMLRLVNTVGFTQMLLPTQ